jgi:monothiol glutaredoxin
MTLAPRTQEQIQQLIDGNRVVLFMKGNREQPQCGFSMQVVGVLDRLLPHYATFDVLSDPVIREGIKEFSDWPTIPQLYVQGQFLGGCDVVKEMYANGELHEVLGLEREAPPAPKVTISESAAQAFRQARKNSDDLLHLGIDARFHYSLGFGPRQPDDVQVESNGIQILLDPDSARRADGLRIDAKQSPRGPQLSIDNPNEPKVTQIRPAALKALFDSGERFLLVDVRTPAERQRASIQGSRLLDEAFHKELAELPKDTKLVFHCHHGGRSQQAALEFAGLGFRSVHNLEGGIDAWSSEVDATVPKY